VRAAFTTPGSTRARRFTGSTSRMRFIRAVPTMTPPCGGQRPPESPVPAPRGTTGMRASWRSGATPATWSGRSGEGPRRRGTPGTGSGRRTRRPGAGRHRPGRRHPPRFRAAIRSADEGGDGGADGEKPGGDHGGCEGAEGAGWERAGGALGGTRSSGHLTIPPPGGSAQGTGPPYERRGSARGPTSRPAAGSIREGVRWRPGRSRSAPLGGDLLGELVGDGLDLGLDLRGEGVLLVGVDVDLAVDLVAGADQHHELGLHVGEQAR
jgi:hypothetical protein